MNPVIEQEKKNGHDVLLITENVYAEVSEFKGKIYCSIRKWFEKDKKFYRSRNGINVEPEDWNDIVAKIEEIDKFIQEELDR